MQAHATRYTSTYFTMTKDYRGTARPQVCRNSSSTDDENPEGHIPRPSDSAQVCKTPGQKSPGKFFYIVRTRNRSRSREQREHALEAVFQKLFDKAVTPSRATPGSVGYDVYTPINFVLAPRSQQTIFIDIAVKPPDGYYAQLMTKSGLATLYELEVEVGVIDSDYMGNIGVILRNNSRKPVEHLAGEQITQLLFVKVATPLLVQVDNLADTQHGQYGFRAHTTV